MKEIIKKTSQTLRDNGVSGFSRKLLRYGAARLDGLKPASMRHKALLEEHRDLSNPVFQVTNRDILESRRLTQQRTRGRIQSAIWFVPPFSHLSFGGTYTIFRVIEKLSKQGVFNTVVVYGDPFFNADKTCGQIAREFPGLKNYQLKVLGTRGLAVDDLPDADLGFCTYWTSAYHLLKFARVRRKFYFVQDYEPLFFSAGSMSALAESTYRFGFTGIFNSPGLAEATMGRHGMEGFSFVPAVDTSIYFPDFVNKGRGNGKVKLFFYARPANARNAFNLGLMAIQQLVRQFPEKLEVVAAGAKWDESVYGLKGRIRNLGLLKSLREVAEVYRGCDIGMVFMLSRHPSYQPLEFMASGMATVTNRNEDNLWLLRDGENCLLSEPSPAAMAERVGELVCDDRLRMSIARKGHEEVSRRSWDSEIDGVWRQIEERW